MLSLIYIYLFQIFDWFNVFEPIADVLSEDVILKWYTKDHSSKGKGHFLEQMKKFVEWLQNAEEGIHSISFEFIKKKSFSNFVYLYFFLFK